MIDWKKYFDKIYCIQFLPKRYDRINRITNELDRVGILNSGILSWKLTYQSPFQRILQQNISIKHVNLINDLGAFNCAFAHYEVHKEAKGLDLNRILVLEEDISFLKDLNRLEVYLENMPSTDVCLLDKFCYDPYKYQCDLINDSLQCNQYFRYFDKTCGHFGSGACYSLSNKALNAFITVQEKTSFHCADELWNDWGNDDVNNNLTKSYAVVNLGYQKPFSDSVHNNIELAYKFVNLDKELYN